MRMQSTDNDEAHDTGEMTKSWRGLGCTTGAYALLSYRWIPLSLPTQGHLWSWLTLLHAILPPTTVFLIIFCLFSLLVQLFLFVRIYTAKTDIDPQFGTSFLG